MKCKSTEIIEIVKNTKETMIVVDINGEVKKYIPFSIALSKVSLSEFSRIIGNETKKGFAVGFLIRDKKFDEVKLKKKIKGLVEALQYSKKHPLKSGVNIPGNKKYYSIKQKLAEKLGIKE